MLNKKIVFPIVALTMLGAGIVGGSQVLAQNFGNSHDTLVERIAERFNLKQEEVQAVFDEVGQERREKMQDLFETRLSEEVSNGTITEDQKQLILNKHKEMIANRETRREESQNLTREEFREKRESEREELETWAQENGINLAVFGKFGFGGPGKGRHW